MIIRAVTTIEECRQVAALEMNVWEYTDKEDVVPPPVLIVAAKRGGILLGAFDQTRVMKGFVYSIPGVKDGALTQWSQRLSLQRKVPTSNLAATHIRDPSDQAHHSRDGIARETVVYLAMQTQQRRVRRRS